MKYFSQFSTVDVKGKWISGFQLGYELTAAATHTEKLLYLCFAHPFPDLLVNSGSYSDLYVPVLLYNRE